MQANLYHTNENPEFEPRNERVTWAKKGGQVFTNLYTPSQRAKEWDGAVWANAAIGIRSFGDKASFSYCDFRITGRKIRRIPGPEGLYGIKARITMGGAAGTEDAQTWDAWLMKY